MLTSVSNAKIENTIIDINSKSTDELSFNFIPNTAEVKVKAGDTVTIKLNVADIKVGENGLNNIIGSLNYDENLFDIMQIDGTNNWNIELNKRKSHQLYGKFCMYTMSEGITENQNIAIMTLKLKKDLKPQTTEIKFSNLKSSDGNTSVEDENKSVKIIIYEDEVTKENTINENNQDETKNEIKNLQNTQSIKTGDNVLIAIIGLIVSLMILVNIIILCRNKKIKIIFSTIVIISALACICFVAFAESIDETITQKIAQNESLLNSEEYLVTDADITRVNLHTTIEQFKSKFNNGVSVFNEEKSEQTGELEEKEITTGNITTGMKVKVSDEKNEYTIGVAGDLDKDGESNQVELTSIIRNVINNSKWGFDSIKAKVADMKLDGNINEQDIKASVNYIVYGELEIPKFEQVKSPKIEVVNGTFNKNINAYEDNIEVKITATEVDCGETKYKIIGSKDTEYAEIKSGDTITITENGIYKICAYTYGKLENRSEISNLVVSKKIPTANYTVEYYKENLDGTFSIDEKQTEIKVGRIGENATAISGEIKGFSEDLNNKDIVRSGTVKQDGSLTLKLYYTRNLYNLNLVKGDNISNVTGSGSYKFGETIDITAELNTITGYTTKFEQWESNDTTLLQNIEGQSSKIVMPIGDITLTATAENVANDYKYVVEYYYDNVKDDSKTIVGTEQYKVNIVYPSDKVPDKIINGYELDKKKGTDGIVGVPLIITENEFNNIIKVYYKKIIYNIVYVLNDGKLEKENPNIYDVTTESFELNNPVKTGYSFDGWILTKLNDKETTNEKENLKETIEKGSTGNRVYTSKWEPKTDTKYEVQHYIEKLDGTYELNDTEELKGTTDTIVNAKSAKENDNLAQKYNGFTIDLTNTNTIQKGNIKPDGSLVLKLYYTRNSYNYTIKYYYENSKGIYETKDTDDETKTAKYEEKITSYEEKCLSGYTLASVEQISSQITVNQNPANLPLNISIDENKNIISVYYKLNTYTVEYILNDGNLSQGENNPKTYTVLDNDFILSIPQKTDYIFEGWVLTKLNGENKTGEVENKNVTIETQKLANYTYTAMWKKAEGKVIIHHYIEESTTKVKEDETISSTIGDSFIVTNLISGSNLININGKDQENPRLYLDASKYSYIDCVRNETNTTIGQTQEEMANGKISGLFTGITQEITYYYKINTYTITGEVIGNHGKIYSGGKEYTTETVNYGEDSIKQITLIPENNYKIEKIMIYTGSEVDGSYNSDTDGGIEISDYETGTNGEVTLQLFKDVTENKHITVTFKQKEIVAQIVEVPEGSKEYVGEDGNPIINHTYFTLSDAINDAKISNKNPGVVSIKLLSNIKNETNIISDNNNISIDLNGFEISSASVKPILKINSATLIVKDESIIQTGKIVNTNKDVTSVGIWIEPTGTCTLGYNDNIQSAIPSVISPTVQGNTYGIYKEKSGETEGIFNFYDGKIIGGKSAIGGSTKIDDKPALYDVSIVAENDKQTAVLAVVNGIEALIGNTRFNTLEDAFSEVEANQKFNVNTPVEIDVVAEVTIEDPIVLSKNKNVKLDLNGHSITGVKDNYVFENSGKLEIIDTTKGKDDEYSELMTKSELYKNVVKNGDYYFEKIGDNCLSSNNKSIVNSVANSYIEIDLTNKASTDTFILGVNAEISSEANYDFGYATISNSTDIPEYNTETGRFIYISGDVSAKTYSKTLKGGNKYYLHFGYKKDGGTDTGADRFIINGVNLYTNIDTTDYINNEISNGNDKYYFQKVDNTLQSNNQKIANSTANSYEEIDLTSIPTTQNAIVRVNAEISSETNYDFGYATITNSTDIPTYDNTEGRFIYISGNVSDRAYETSLAGGKKYYLHFGYRKDGSTDTGTDTFTVKHINILKPDINGTSLLGETQEQAQNYYFEKVGDHLESNNSDIANSTAKSYVLIDLTNKKETETFSLNINANISSYSNCYGYATIKNDEQSPSATDTEGRFIYIYGLTAPTDYTTTLNGGKKYYLHLGYENKNINEAYLNTFMINSITLNDKPLLQGIEHTKGVIRSTANGVIKNEETGTLTLTKGTLTSSYVTGNEIFAVVKNYGTFSMKGGLISSEWINYKQMLVISNEEKANTTIENGIINGTIKNNANSNMIIDKTARIITNESQKNSIENWGILEIRDIQMATACYWSSCIVNNTNAELTVQNGRITSIYGTIINNSSNKCTINGGNFGCSQGISNNSEITVNGGKIVAIDSAGISNYKQCNINNFEIYNSRIGIENRNNDAIIKINNVNMHNCNTGISSTYTSSTIIENCTIENCTTGISIQKGTIDINGGKINATGNTINNSKYGTVNITGGTIIGGTTANTSNIYNEGNLNIGTKNTQDNTEVSTTTPYIKGGTSACISNVLGTLKYYDGIIIGPENNSIKGTISEIEEKNSEGKKLDVISTQITENEVKLEQITLGVQTIPVARILKTTAGLDLTKIDSYEYTSDDTYYYFTNLTAATSVCNIQASDIVTKIEVINNIITSKVINILDGQNIEIDINGNDIELISKESGICNSGKLKIIDSSEKVTGIICGDQINIIKNTATGTFELAGGTINLLHITEDIVREIIYNEGIANINGGTITGACNINGIHNKGILNFNNGKINVSTYNNWNDNYYGVSCIYNTDNGKCIINGGSLNGNYYYGRGITNDDTANLYVNGGEIYGYDKGIYNNSTKIYEENVSDAAINITGGTVTAYICTIYNNSKSDIIIKKAENTEIKISSLQVNGSAIETYTFGKLIIYGAKINEGNTNTNYFAIESNSENTDIKKCNIIGRVNNNNSGTLTIEDSSIINNTNYNAVLNNSTGIIKIIGNEGNIIKSVSSDAIRNASTGNIEISEEGKQVIKSENNAGIWNSGNGSITIGEKGNETISTQYPQITGKTYGVSNASSGNTSGKLYFYDGILTGATSKSIQGNVTDKEEGYDIIKTNNTETSTESAILKKMTTVKVAINDVVINNLTGIECSKDSEFYNFYCIADAVKACADNVKTKIYIARNTIYPANHTTETIGKDKNIILDLNGFSLDCSNENVIENNGILEIIDSSENKSGEIKGNAQNVINNNGTLNLTNVKITSGVSGTSNTDYKNIINNTGTITVDEGTYKSTGLYIRLFNNTGILNITNDKTIITVNYGYSPYSDSIFTNNKLNISGGQITGNIENDEIGNVKITGIDYTGQIYNRSTSKYKEGESDYAIEITKGTFKSTNGGYNIYNNKDSGDIKIAQSEEDGINIYNTYNGETIENDENSKLIIDGAYIHGSEAYDHTIKNIGTMQIVNAKIDGNIENEKNELTIENGTITGNVCSDDYYYNEGTINFKGGTINGHMINNEASTINVAGGTINSTTNNAAILNYGTLNIGTNDGKINTESPKISAIATDTKYVYAGVQNDYDGIVNYYDGIITGTGNAIYGKVDSIADDSEIIPSSDEKTQTYILGKTQDVAAIGETKYATLSDAIIACTSTSNTVIKLLQPIVLTTGKEISISATQNVTLDLNGNAIYCSSKSTQFTNLGTFEIIDTQENSLGLITGWCNGLIKNTGSCTLTSGKLQLYGTISRTIINNLDQGNVIISGGNIEIITNRCIWHSYTWYCRDKSDAKGYGIYSTSSNNITITGGNLNCYNGDEIAIYVNNSDANNIANVNISGDTVIKSNGTSSVGTGVIITNAKLNITSGNISTYYGLQIKSGEAQVTGGTITGQTGVDKSGKLVIKDNATLSGITNSGIVEMSGGTVTGKPNYGDFLIDNVNKLNITGGIVRSTEVSAIENRGDGTLNIKNATIESTNGYGIYIDNNSNSIVSLGENDYGVIKLPSITGSTYGVYNAGNGKFNFYDGIIKGSTNAIYGTVTVTPYLYSVVYTSAANTTAYLGIIATVDQVCKVGDLYYNTLQGAVDAIKTSGSTGTISVLKDIKLSEPLVIDKGLNITIDLQAHSIETSNSEKGTIVNKGTLIITDTTEVGEIVTIEGKIKNAVGTAIQNEGILTIGENNENMNIHSPQIVGNTYAIENSENAVLNMYDGILKGGRDTQITNIIKGTVSNILQGYSIAEGTETIGEGEQAITYLTKYLKK